MNALLMWTVTQLHSALPGPPVLTAGELDMGLGKGLAAEIWWRVSGKSLVPWSLIMGNFVSEKTVADQAKQDCLLKARVQRTWVLPDFPEGQQLSGRNMGQRRPPPPITSLKARGPGQTCCEHSSVLGDCRLYSREKEWGIWNVLLSSVPSCFGCVRLSATLWPVACLTPLSMGFPKQEYDRALPCPSPGYLPDPEIKPASSVSPALQEDSLPTKSPGNPFPFLSFPNRWQTIRTLSPWVPAEGCGHLLHMRYHDGCRRMML